jgi:hypothetical protein
MNEFDNNPEIDNTNTPPEPTVETVVEIVPDPTNSPEVVLDPEITTPPVPDVSPEVTPELTPETTPEATPEPVVESPVETPAIPTTTPAIVPQITELTQSWALVRDSDGLVETFLRLDLPLGWKAPEGFSLIPDDQLPAGWSKILQEIPVPQTITATQIRLWLVNNGFSMNQIYDIISQIPDPLLKAQIEVQWEYAPYVERDHPMINTLGASLGLSSEQIDQAFREASVLL